MMKLLTSASIATLIAVGGASAQTTAPTPSQADRPAGVQVKPPVTPHDAKTDAAKPAGVETPSSAEAPSSRTDKPASSAAAKPAMGSSMLKLTDAEAKQWLNKVIYSSDDKNIGEVAAFERTPDGKVEALHADIGGFLGIGESRVRIMPDQFSLQGDRVILKVSSEAAKTLPKVGK